MSTTTKTETTETTPPADADQQTAEGQDQPRKGEANPANAEAARYRARLRETETERDTLTQRLAGYQRREAERLAAKELSRPSDLWLDGAEVADLLDDAGEVDPAKVEKVLADVLTDRPQLRAGRRPKPDDAQGAPVPASRSGWHDVLRGGKG